jgi:hypothetical protein
MYEYNERIDGDTKNSNNNPSKIDKKFLDELSKFIQSAESEMDIMLPGSASLQFSGKGHHIKSTGIFRI